MNKKIVAARMPLYGTSCIVTVLYEDGHAAEVSVISEERPSPLGNIYLGRIENIQKNLGAAFVRLGEEGNGYLPLPKGSSLKQGDEILVQVEKEAIKQKLPRLTAELTMPGRYMVLTSGDAAVHFSRKLTSEEKERIGAAIREVCPVDTDRKIGVVVRTNAREASPEELAEEYRILHERLGAILQYGPTRTCYSCLFKAPGDWVRMLKSCSLEDLEKITTDSEIVYREITECLRETGSGQRVNVSFYEDPMVSLYKLFNFTTLLTELETNRVWLKSGGFLVIEQTEAFTAVDVNTGRMTVKKSPAETAALTNREAACELIRQLRLRELSGTILVDFINMRDPSEQKALIEYMRTLLQSDSANTNIIDFTALCICEITRRKTRKSFKEQIKTIHDTDPL
ncbi:MAG: ribonuclease E/G [Eubacterium sp.]|nr:ribonuclease E/G [Eubacterium sp.]